MIQSVERRESAPSVFLCYESGYLQHMFLAVQRIKNADFIPVRNADVNNIVQCKHDKDQTSF